MNQNEFKQSATVGQIDLSTNPSPNVLTCRVASTYAGNGIQAGVGLKLADLGASDVNGLPVVTVAAADTDVLLGTRVFSTKKGLVTANDVVEVAFDKTIVYMEASAALNRGVKVAAVVATPGQVQAVGVNAELGITLDKATASGDLIRILLTSEGA